MIKILNKCPGCESGELKLSCCHANAAQEHVVKSGDIWQLPHYIEFPCQVGNSVSVWKMIHV